MTNEPMDQPSRSASHQGTPEWPSPSKPRWWEPYTPAKQPVAWLGGVGGSLILAAAGAGAAARWGTIGVGARVAVLLCIHMIVLVLSERMRRSLPIVANSLAHLGASLVVPSTIAIAAFFEQSWRVCIAVGGLAGIAALEVQAKRWNAKLLRGGEVVAVGLAAAGAAAITHAPLGVLLGGAAIALYVLGLRKRAATTAAAAAITPALAVLATFNVGHGTIAELGARGSLLAWAAPVASTLAAVVFGLEAKRLRSKAFLAAALGSLVLGGSIAAWHDAMIREIGFPLLVAGGLLIAEVAALIHEKTKVRNATAQLTDASQNSKANRIAGLDFAELFGFAVIAASAGSSWYVPGILVSVAFLVGAVRRNRFLPFAVPLTLSMWGAAVTASQTVQNLRADTSSGFEIFGLDGELSAGLWCATIVLGICSAVRKSRPLGFGVGLAVAGSMLAQFSAADETLSGIRALACLVLGTVALGVSVALDRKINGADLAGLILVGGSAAFVGWPWAPALVVLCGVACALVGTAKQIKLLTQIGGVLVLGGGVAVLDDSRVPNDVAAGAIIAAVAVAEWFEAHRGKNRLIPFAISSLMGGLWLVAQCFEDLSATRLSVTLVIGIAAVVVGVVRKLNPVAIAGAAVCMVTVWLASKDRLAALPTWVWAMSGGIALLAAAIGLERRTKSKAKRTQEKGKE